MVSQAFISISLIKPKGQLSTKSPELLARQIVENTLLQAAKDAKEMFVEPTLTWKGSAVKGGRDVAPEFNISPIKWGNEVSITIWTESNVYKFLDFGTSIRWAIMSKNFIPKTKAGSFSPGAGRGRATLRGKNMMNLFGEPARPGIDARGWTDMVAEQSLKNLDQYLLSQLSKIPGFL